jgi:dTDP-4-amino-4,6-dideoxyglucose formyltransferase
MYHFRNILVITDNTTQYDRFKALVEDRKFNGVNFTFRHSHVISPIHQHPDFKDKNHVIAVKESVQELIDKYDLIISLHCFQLFPPALVNAVKCINIHPGYNPVNRGWYPQVFAIINKLPIGATIHEMDAQLDNGPIIARKLVAYNTWDTSIDIYNRVLETEMELLEKNIDNILKNTYTVLQPEPGGNLFLKKDFNNLCKIDLDETGTFASFIDRLRALTHGAYKNAWFIDEQTGRKVYVSIQLNPEP